MCIVPQIWIWWRRQRASVWSVTQIWTLHPSKWMPPNLSSREPGLGSGRIYNQQFSKLMKAIYTWFLHLPHRKIKTILEMIKRTEKELLGCEWNSQVAVGPITVRLYAHEYIKLAELTPSIWLFWAPRKGYWRCWETETFGNNGVLDCPGFSLISHYVSH